LKVGGCLAEGSLLSRWDMTDWKRLVQELQSGLPQPLIKRRCRLLPKILHEWSRTDLREHLSLESRGEIRAKIKKLEAVKKRVG
jgi:hypothetical protein